jgi:hypothetical protein
MAEEDEGVTDGSDLPLGTYLHPVDRVMECDHCHKDSLWCRYLGYPRNVWEYFCLDCANREVQRVINKEKDEVSEWAVAGRVSCLVCESSKVTPSGLTCPMHGRFEVVTLEALTMIATVCGNYLRDPEASLAEEFERLRRIAGERYVERI